MIDEEMIELVADSAVKGFEKGLTMPCSNCGHVEEL